MQHEVQCSQNPEGRAKERAHRATNAEDLLAVPNGLLDVSGDTPGPCHPDLRTGACRRWLALERHPRRDPPEWEIMCVNSTPVVVTTPCRPALARTSDRRPRGAIGA